MGIDIRTLVLVSTIVSLIVALTFGAATWNFSERKRPTAWWALGFLLLAGGFLSLYLRGFLVPVVSIVLANAFLASSAVALLWGIDTFIGKRPRFLWGIIIVVGVCLLSLVFTFAWPRYDIRVVIITLPRVAITVCIAMRLLRHVARGLRLQRGVTTAFFLADALVELMRAIIVAAGVGQNEVLANGPASLSLFISGFIIPICAAIGLLSMVARQTELDREKTIAELEIALGKVRTLSGLLPICASCKRIRDENGTWQQVELYVRDRTHASFSHSICPDCTEKLYPGMKPLEPPGG
jgi:hypothetical protein